MAYALAVGLASSEPRPGLFRRRPGRPARARRRRNGRARRRRHGARLRARGLRGRRAPRRSHDHGDRSLRAGSARSGLPATRRDAPRLPGPRVFHRHPGAPLRRRPAPRPELARRESKERPPCVTALPFRIFRSRSSGKRTCAPSPARTAPSPSNACRRASVAGVRLTDATGTVQVAYGSLAPREREGTLRGGETSSIELRTNVVRSAGASLAPGRPWPACSCGPTRDGSS